MKTMAWQLVLLNVLRIIAFGGGLDQITPGPESGVWGGTGNSTVSGFIRHDVIVQADG